MQTAIVLIIFAIALCYVGRKVYRSATAKGGCGCGCSGCTGKKPSSKGGCNS